MNNEYLHTNPGIRSKFHLEPRKQAGRLGVEEPESALPVRVRCARCPGWGGIATTTREMRAVYAAHAERRHS